MLAFIENYQNRFMNLRYVEELTLLITKDAVHDEELCKNRPAFNQLEP